MSTKKRKQWKQLWDAAQAAPSRATVSPLDAAALTEAAKKLKSGVGSAGQQPTSDTARLKQEALDAYMNREDFSYDLNGDALYRQYQDRYLRQGKMAMEDTMGKASGLTGGYGSSYAQNVGQQAYNEYLQELNDVIPELYQLAYDRYQDKGQELYQRYALLDEQEQQEYERGRDAVADQQWEQKQQEEKRRYDLDYALDRQKQEEDVRQFDLNYGLDKEKQAEEKRQFDLGYGLDKEKQAEDQRQFDLEYGLAQKKASADSDSGSGENLGGYYAWLSQLQGKGQRPDANDPTDITKYDNGKVSTGNIMAMQRAIGVEPDGMWSKRVQNAAGGLTADQAWAAYQKGQLQIRQSVGMGDMGVPTADIRAMERALGTIEDGAWDSRDAAAAGGISAEEAWKKFQKGLLQNR